MGSLQRTLGYGASIEAKASLAQGGWSPHFMQGVRSSPDDASPGLTQTPIAAATFRQLSPHSPDSLCYNLRTSGLPFGCQGRLMSLNDRPAAMSEPQLVRGLRLRRPLAALDLETTGTTPSSDRIVEISILRLALDGSEKLLRRRVNPQVPIPEGATAVHGITDIDVAGEPTFAELAEEIEDFLEGCDLAGFNVTRFDLPMLEAEFQRAGITFPREGRSVVDAMTIFHLKEPRDLAAAARFYLDRPMPEVHTSETDARATLDVLSAQVQRYPDVPEEIEALHEFCNPVDPDWIDAEGKFVWAGGVATIAFGGHNGRALQELAIEPEPNYLHWMLSKDFSPEVMRIVRDALDGTFPTLPATDAE